MRIAKNDVPVKIDAPGAVARQMTDFGDATGYGKIGGEYFSLGAGTDINAADKTGITALMEASATGQRRIVEELIIAGADVNLKTQAGVGALKRANLAGHSEIAKLLQDAGATEAAPSAQP